MDSLYGPRQRLLIDELIREGATEDEAVDLLKHSFLWSWARFGDAVEDLWLVTIVALIQRLLGAFASYLDKTASDENYTN